MTNRDVYLKKLKLPRKYLEERAVAAMLRKPGTLSKKEKEWVKSYVSLLEFAGTPRQAPSRTKLSQSFISLLRKESI